MRRKEKQSWHGLAELWDHQRQALELLENYLESRSEKAALIHMPTGTGKSGVIAVLAQCMPRIRHGLLLTPWETLRRQLRNDVNVDPQTSSFWKNVRPNGSVARKEVIEIWPSSLQAKSRRTLAVFCPEHPDKSLKLEEAEGKPTVVVGTIQALQWLHRHRKDRPEYDRLSELISFIVVDEGHYEPAPDWAEAVRDLAKPTVLFTATPYRNDLKLFDIDEDFIFTLTYHEAVKKAFVRTVRFQHATASTADAFVDDLLAFFHGDFQKLKPHPNPKVIVRCKTDQSVNLIATQKAGRALSLIPIGSEVWIPRPLRPTPFALGGKLTTWRSSKILMWTSKETCLRG